jgi:hypothetical protein
MIEQRLEELAVRIKGLLKEFEIQDEGFQLKIITPKAYYDSIKNNFSKRNTLDVIVGTRKDDWVIDLMYIFARPIDNQE